MSLHHQIYLEPLCINNRLDFVLDSDEVRGDGSNQIALYGASQTRAWLSITEVGIGYVNPWSQ